MASDETSAAKRAKTRQTIGIIGTGGTISCQAQSCMDTVDYPEYADFMTTEGVIALLPAEVQEHFDLRAIPYSAVPSTAIGTRQWAEIAGLITTNADNQPDIHGFVITHGTATLEESAYSLSLVLKVEQTVAVVGAQRPASAVGADGVANLLSAIRLVSDKSVRGNGVLVVFNDEVHAARDVTKTSNYRMNTFQSPELGPLGVIDGDAVQLHRQSEKLHTAHSVFSSEDLLKAPRVDVSMAYSGADGTAVRAFVAAGARGIVSCAMPPGVCPPDELQALKDAQSKGIIIVQASRAGGRVARRRALTEYGFVAANGLNALKARILLLLALTRTSDIEAIQQFFNSY